MQIGQMYRNKITGDVNLWSKYGDLEEGYSVPSKLIDQSKIVGKLEYGDVFMLVDMKGGTVPESVYLKILMGNQLGWFGCDEETLKKSILWTLYFEHLDPKDFLNRSEFLPSATKDW